MADRPLRPWNTCNGCGLTHRLVECLCYCPNPLCSGSGGTWFRLTLPSYQETSPSRHSVDPAEWLERGLAHALEDAVIAAAREVSAEKLQAKLAGKQP